MARPKGSASTVGDIPDGPLVEILSRVPAKSVCRFKCVSSGWRDLIADPQNRKKLPQAMRGLFSMTLEISEAAAGGGNVESFGFSFVDLTAGSVPLDIDASFSFLTELPDIKTLLLLTDSCNGLILFEHREEFQVEDGEFLSVHAYSSQIGTLSNNQIGEQEEQGQLEG